MAVDVESEEGLVLGIPKVMLEIPFADAGFDVASDGQRFVVNVRAESDPPPRKLVLVKNWIQEIERLVPTNN
jgi:hypothetical protein